MLKDEPRTDTVVLRLAIAGTLARRRPRRSATSPRCASASPWPTQRPEASIFHGREQAMFALVRRARAGARARRWRAATSRSSASRSTCCVFAEAAQRERRQREAIDEARRLKAAIGLHDRRIDALL